MPFEVFPIESMRSMLPISTANYRGLEENVARTPELVAEEIKDVYAKVAEHGGRIVAGHEVHALNLQNEGIHRPWLMLVAEYPDDQTQKPAQHPGPAWMEA